MQADFPADASTLIYLAKADALDQVALFIGSLLAPPGVWAEAVDAGERIGAPEVVRMRRAHESGFVDRTDLSPDLHELALRLADERRLGHGESEVLALGTELGRAIVDEGRAAREARALGIALVVSTLFLPVVGRRSGELIRESAQALLERLAVVTGARADVVFAIAEELRKP